MCPVNRCCCASSDSSGWAVIGSVIVAFVTGLIFLVRRLIVPLVRHVIAPAVMIALVMTWRWLSGAAMNGHARQASFLHGSVPPVLPPRRFGPRLHWAHWPGYQRAIVRWVATAVLVAGLFYPVATAAALAVVVAAVLVLRYRHRIRQAVRSRRPAVIQVSATVAAQPAAALPASSDAPTWSATAQTAQARR